MRWLWGAAGALFLLVSGLAAEEADRFFPARSCVVLMSGLPGDIESEQRDRAQLQDWLEVAGKAAPDEIFVLCDEPNLAPVPGQLPVQRLQASRQEFLKLGKRLAGRTQPVVVVVWGRGGLQGQAPVFYVRGPRLTVEDFKFFAAQLSRADSRWVLSFRGSGQFARALAGERRRIIASENERISASDPVGLPLALERLQANPALDFTAFADELGRLTAAWYAKKNIDRTEEPTLWLGTEQPKPLISLEHTPSPASGTEPASASTALPESFKQLTRVDPRRYPGEEAVILKQYLHFTIRSSPAVDVDQEQFIQVLAPEGKHFGDFDLAYSPLEENLTFRDCEVLRPDGKLLRLDPREILETREESLGDFQKTRRLFFALPGIEPGAVVHFRYFRARNKYPLPHVWLEVPLRGKAPVVDARLEVTLAKNLPFHYGWHHAPPAKPEISDSLYGTTYRWRFADVPADVTEALAPLNDAPALLLSTFPDWAAFVDWYAGIIKQTDMLTPELSAKAAELTRDAKTEREKIVALYNYVTGLRYVAVPLGINAIRPHPASQVLKNQFGDCKDKATLLNTLLRAAGIEAQLVLVPRFAQAYEALPGLAFNHAISRTRLNGESLWLDSTEDVCRFGMLPPGDAGRKALVIAGGTTGLTQLPAPDPQEHALRLRGSVNASRENEGLPAGLEAIARGYSDYELRSAAQAMKLKEYGQPLLGLSFRLAAGAFALARQQFTAVSSLEENFHWRAEGQCLGLRSRTANRMRLSAPFWIPKEWDLALAPRRQRLCLNQGYPLLLDQEWTLLLPGSAGRVELPAPRENTEPPLRWKISWSHASPTNLTARLETQLAGGELSGSETAALQAQLRKLFSYLAEPAQLEIPPSPAAASKSPGS